MRFYPDATVIDDDEEPVVCTGCYEQIGYAATSPFVPFYCDEDDPDLNCYCMTCRPKVDAIREALFGDGEYKWW